MEEQNLPFVVILILVIAFFIILSLKKKLENERKQLKKLTNDNARLLADNALLESEHLKFQLQPHTLNNILANLKSIANKLNKGMDAFSETLDYILYHGHTNLVSIQDEMNFIKKYLALNDLFISEIDSIKFDGAGVNTNIRHYTNACVPHLISAYFIENAFKHGDVNHPEFLKITLKLSEKAFEMHVVNKVKANTIEKKGGLGLVNMRKRLELLLTGSYEIKTLSTANEYQSTLIIHF